MGKKLLSVKNPEVSTNVFVSKEQDTNEVLFSFKYLSKESFAKSKDYGFFVDLLQRFAKYSQLGWEGIRSSHRHTWGMEKMPTNQIKHVNSISRITPDVKTLDVLRSSGDNHVLVGLQERQVFSVFFIEAHFGDISPH